MKRIIIVILLATCACVKQDPEPIAISDIEIEINYDKEHQFAIKQGSKTITSGVEWKVFDTTIGKVDENGLFKARKVGSTFITGSSSKGKVEGIINIKPYSNMYATPYIKFGASGSDVRHSEKREYWTTTDNTLAFFGENNKVRYVFYVFEKSKLVAAAVSLNGATSTIEEFALYHKERYPQWTPIEDRFGHISDDKSHAIFISLERDLSLLAMYFPYDPNSLRKSSSKDYQAALKEKIKVLDEMYDAL